MLKKLLLLSFALIFIASFANAGPRLTKEQLDKTYGTELVVKRYGDGTYGVIGKNSFNANWHPVLSNSKFTDNVMWDTTLISRIYMPSGQDNIMDMQSNGCPVEIIQDPNNPNKIHVILQYAPPGDGTASPNRRTKYFYSNDKGQTFVYVGNVSEDRTGYASITLTPGNGIEMISTHVGSSPVYYLDAATGLGSWTKLEAEKRPYVWLKTAFTSSLTNPMKFVTVLAPNGTDSAFWFNCSSMSPTPGTFGPYNLYYSSDGEAYQIASSTDGKVGIIYKANDVLIPNDVGDLFLMESTDNGVSFGAPLKIFDADISPSGDSLAAFRGMGIVYQGSNPCVVFETARQTTEGGFFSSMPQNIRFWSKTLPGSDPNRSIIIVDTNNTPFYQFYIPTSNTSYDIYVTYCRPAIGRAASGNGLFVTFMAPAGVNMSDGAIWGGVDTTVYEANYVLYSGDGGLNWVAPKRITPIDTTTVGGQYTKMKDYTYPSISQTNDVDANFWYLNMVVIEDSIPGSYQYHTNNGEPRCKQLYMRIKIPRADVGIQNVSNTTPSKYALNQNYPNPFNPVTSIRFSLPKVSVVTLKVYDITGKLVSTLVNNETVSIGEKEVKFDASNLSSGVYFYSIQAGDFSDTRKMIVLK
ncbi:MAG: T9SS type A sorting domain-containing protein [Ignavibacteria bacterium]|jgi:hypothetical protein